MENTIPTRRHEPDDGRSAITLRVLDRIRQDIVLGRLVPGEHLVELPLAERYQVSRGSLRTAFTILEKEGIVHTLPNGRKIVAGLDVKYVSDLFEVRCALESQAHAEILQMARPDYDSLTVLLQLLGSAGQPLDYDAYCRIDIDFHRAMIVLSGNRALLQTWETTAPVMLTLMQLNTDEAYRQDFMTRFVERHHHFVDLILTRDPAICDYTRSHIMSARDASCRRIEAYRQKLGLTGLSRSQKPVP